MELTLMTQDLINAVCLYAARQRNVSVDAIEAELVYDDELQPPFVAEVTYEGTTNDMLMPELIAAIRLYIDEYEQIDPLTAAIELQLTDDHEFIALVR